MSLALVPAAKTTKAICPTHAPGAPKTLIFLLLTAGYFDLHIILRWLRYPLFSGSGPNTWAPPSTGELLYHVFSGCLPAFVWCFVLYAAVCWCPRFVGRVVLPLVLWLALMLVELDMSWYGMSKHHATWHEAHTFLTENWSEQFGVQRSDVVRFAGHMALHGLLLLFLACLAQVLARRPLFRRLTSGRGLVLACIVALLFFEDGLVVHARLLREVAFEDRSMWCHLVTRNPLRIRIDKLLPAERPGSGGDLAAANDALSALPTPDDEGGETGEGLPLPAAPAGRRLNVLFLVVESFSARLESDTNMPHLRALAERSIRLGRHYSTGNCTHYAVAGLLHGSPVTFFRGKLGGGPCYSPYLELFTAHGYRSKQLASTNLNFFHLEEYLGRFTEPPFETRSHTELLPPVRAELARPGGSFVLVFYYGPHFPYLHGPKFTAYQPEVPGDYDYAAWDLLDHREAIINRYKNCLDEFDSWLGSLLKDVDLDNTIVVVTGDHGEELFETGRLGHASTLEDSQVRTPCLIHVPGMCPGRVDFITSHADLMPTVAEALGWQVPSRSWGRSLFRPETGRGAVVAHTELAYPPRHWLAVTAAGKTFVDGARGEPVHITRFRGPQDECVSFQDDPERWRANLRLIRKLQDSLAVQP